MPHEGMVHALERIRALLRPDGALIDIHPVRGAPLIEVHSAEGVLLAEPSPAYDYDEDLRHAEDALAWAVEHGTFRLDRSREFEFVTYAASIVELRDFFAVAGAYDEGPADAGTRARMDELDARVEEAMRTLGKEAEVAHRERARMTRLIPVR